MISFGIRQYYCTAVPSRIAICDEDLDAIRNRSHASGSFLHRSAISVDAAG